MLGQGEGEGWDSEDRSSTDHETELEGKERNWVLSFPSDRKKKKERRKEGWALRASDMKSWAGVGAGPGAPFGLNWDGFKSVAS